MNSLYFASAKRYLQAQTKSFQMKYILTIIFFFGILVTKGQNLVRNSSFEAHFQCPVANVPDLYGISDWHSVVPGTPDYFNICGDPNKGASVPNNWFGYQSPYDGNAYVGLFGYSKSYFVREYLQSRLTSPLIAGKWYRISFFTSLGDYSAYAINNIGAVLSNDSVDGSKIFTYINLIPAINATEIISDSVNWTKVTGVYKAKGGEQFILLGNFYSDEQTLKKSLYGTTGGSSYYFIDSVTVLATDSAACTEFAVYPNPSAGRIHIKVECETIKQIQIYSASCQLVKEIQGNIRSIDVGDLPAGLYLLVATTDKNKRLVKRIIKSNN